jgi:uncharacterized protein DUF4265
MRPGRTAQRGDQFVKVVFELPRDKDGWPPAASEGLWAIPVSPDVVLLDNTPFFVRGVAAGDLIRVHREADGQLRAAARLQWSGHCTIRIIVFRDGPLGGSRQQVLDMLRRWVRPVRVSSGTRW